MRRRRNRRIKRSTARGRAWRKLVKRYGVKKAARMHRKGGRRRSRRRSRR